MRIIKNGIVKTTFWISVFWWLILSTYQLVFNGLVIGPAVHNFMITMRFVILGTIIGFGYISLELSLKRRSLKRGLIGQTTRGMVSKIGPVPVLKKPNNRKPLVKVPSPKEVPDGFFENWLKGINKTHPQHEALARALLEIHEAHRHLPATHIEGGHGGRTLYEHTALVAWQCHELAKSWKYKGLIANQGRQVIPPANKEFVVNPEDPIYVIAGIAHDLGKIECYIWDDGKIVDSKDVHDSVSAQMLARTEEYWALPDYDRSCLNGAVSFYHKPGLISMKPDGTMDDKMVAIMELLIRADNAASRMESGTHDPDEDQENGISEPVPESEKDKIWNAFVKIINEYGRINSDNKDVRIGQKNTDEQGRALLYLHEESLRTPLGQASSEDVYARYGDGQFKITRKLLAILAEKGCLYQHHNGVTYSDSRAVFRTDFFSKKKGGTLEHLSEWKVTIIIVADQLFPGLAAIPDHNIIPQISRPYFGSNSGKKGSEVEIKSISSVDPDDDASYSIQEGTKKKNKEPRSKHGDVHATASIENKPTSNKTDAPSQIKNQPLEEISIFDIGAEDKNLQADLEIQFIDSVQSKPRQVDTMLNGQLNEEQKNDQIILESTRKIQEVDSQKILNDKIKDNDKRPALQSLPKSIPRKPANTKVESSAQEAAGDMPVWAKNVESFEPPSGKKLDEPKFVKNLRHAIRENKIKFTQNSDESVTCRLSTALEIIPESERKTTEEEIRSGEFSAVRIEHLSVIKADVIIIQKK